MTARRPLGLALPAVLAVSLLCLQGCSPRTVAVLPSSGGSVSDGLARLDVVNNSGQTVRSIEASSCSDQNWGPNRLGTSAIEPGRSASFDLPPGCWDFRADFDADRSSGNELVERNNQVVRSWTWTIGG